MHAIIGNKQAISTRSDITCAAIGGTINFRGKVAFHLARCRLRSSASSQHKAPTVNFSLNETKGMRHDLDLNPQSRQLMDECDSCSRHIMQHWHVSASGSPFYQWPVSRTAETRGDLGVEPLKMHNTPVPMFSFV